MTKHLRFNCMMNERHPQTVMRELGVNYVVAQPQMMGDQWWFWCCDPVPEPLPDFLTEITFQPEDAMLSDRAIAKIKARMER